MKVIDVNAAFGFWPIQRVSSRTLEALDAAFAKAGVEEVWLSAVESILYPEPDEWDARLFARLPAFPRFRPVKTVNPLLGNWRKPWDAVAVKLFPNYHGYSLTDERVAELCENTRVPILIQMRVNDERNQPHFMQVAGVSAEEIVALSLRHPAARIVTLCPYNGELPILAKGGKNLMADISFLDGASILEQVAAQLPLVFGSHEAFAHVASARLKLQHSKLPAETLQAIATANIQPI